MKLTEEQRKLVEENHNLIYGFLRRNNLEDDEYYDIVAIGLCKAATAHDSTKGKFSTLAYKYMETEILRQIDLNTRKNKIPKALIYSYSANITNKKQSNALISILFNKHSEDMIDTFITEENFHQFYLLLGEKERLIIDYLVSGYSRIEIASKLGVTPQRIRQRIKGVKIKWKEYNEKGYVTKKKRGRKVQR
jgi:RNA polymerase sigma factor (sigma-70 family)